MASECSFAHGVSLPAPRPPLAVTSCRLRHGAGRTRANRRVVAAARPVSVGAARRMLGSARGVGVARGGGGGGRAAVGPRARRLRAAAGRPPLHRRQNGGRVRRRASGRSGEHPLHAQHRLRNGEELALCGASVGDLRQGRRDHHRMPKWKEISHGSSRTLLRWLHCCDRHRRRVLNLEGEWTAGPWTVTSWPSLNVAET